ncbi:heme-dependent oxidative N-demethylase family protein [Nesterenkonia flava]|uniref:DUF3445 domain-containing protein n=1 Tax=Nesterenkonia flava TaxID=469799 RepID=A0ABU1FUG5_9MICC|nr:DUF3445 domain-containing protein [Nesterenkonia flava]MDR5712268.1 DUF3445 domain-containing protein [Nesterenkonia flava]
MSTRTAADLVTTFPFPFPQDTYRYSTNVEPAGRPVETPAGQWGSSMLAVDSEYHHELNERAEILQRDPSRLQVLDHMRPAAWDAMLTLMQELALAYPQDFSLTRNADGTFTWINHLLGWHQQFTWGDESSLPTEPMAYIGAQVQEDIALLDQRGSELFVDAGVITFAADWSFGFDVGMSFMEIHGPVPRVHDLGVIARAQTFITRLQVGAPYRRTNWSLTIGRRLDVATEVYDRWGPDRGWIQTVDDTTFGDAVHLRVEVQHLVRLPQTGAVMFLIRTCMLPLSELARIEPWRARTHAVLQELPEDMADYKGFLSYRDRAVAWLDRQAPAD